MNQIVSIIQTELARNPMLSSALNAGMLQLMAPNNNLVHMSSQQMSPPQPYQQVGASIPSVQQALNAELSRNVPSMPAPQQPIFPGQNQESNASGDRPASTFPDAASDTMMGSESKETT